MLPLETLKEVREVFGRCQRRYPTIDLSFEPYRARLEEIAAAAHEEHAAISAREPRIGNPIVCSDCLSLLRQLHHEDLFLALACAQGDRIAWEVFADEYLALLRRFAAHACRSCDGSEDLAQEIVALLLGESGTWASDLHQQARPETCESARKGKLQSYNGRGSLAGWLRASVAHAAIDRFRRARKQVSLDELSEQGVSLGSPNPGPAEAVEERLDAHWGPVLAQTLKEEIAHLSARDRLLLSLYHLQGVPLKAIGLKFGVHEATASRWLERVRRGVRKRVEHALRKAHGLSARDLGSLWRWVSESEDPPLDSVLHPSSPNLLPRKKVQGGTI
ncbi:MAG: sigma-70 family RNA polymerase sigma factor [Acidobacteriota bacterium]